MRKFSFIVILTVLCCGCSTLKLENTLWYNEYNTECHGETGQVVTSLLFGEDNAVAIQYCVKNDTTVIVPPTILECGTYTQSGTLKKGIHLKLQTTNLENKELIYEGLIFDQGLILVDADSIAKGFKMATNVRLK